MVEMQCSRGIFGGRPIAGLTRCSACFTLLAPREEIPVKQWTLRGVTPAHPTMVSDGRRGDDASGDSLRALVDQFPGLFWTTDREFAFTTLLGRALTSLGLGPNQLVGMALADLFEEADARASARRAHMRALLGETLSFRLRLGGRRLHARVAPLADARGAVIGVIGLAVEAPDVRLSAPSLVPTS